MKHEQLPGAVPRCDIVHELACIINNLQDKVTIVLGQGFAVLAREQAVDRAPQESPTNGELDPDPELTAFLGTLGLCSFLDEGNRFTKARFTCVDSYDELQRCITWCEDTITYHTLQHKLDNCMPVDLESSIIRALDTTPANTQLPTFMLPVQGLVVPRPRTPS